MYQIFQECSKHSTKRTKCTITFHTTFFFKQNYCLTIIHSQTLQLSCNSFKLSQESYYLYTTVQYLCTPSKMYFHIFFSIYSLPKTERNTQTFYSPLSTVSHNSNIFNSLSILIKVPLQYFSIPSSLINCSSSFLFIVPATV